MQIRAARRGRSGLRSLAVLVVALATTTAGVSAAAPAIQSTGSTPVPGGEQVAEAPVRVVQANINKDMSAKKFRADVATVMAQQPDFIAYNEVYRRADADLVPPGFAMFRTPGPRTGWAPVAWDASVWTAVDQGTVQISKRPAKFKSGMVGVRFATWVTLTDVEGRVVSVISAHIAPNSRDTAHLLTPSLRVLAGLAGELSARGPVVLAGDFNMGLRSSRYAPQPLEAVGLRSTYDLLGTSFPTHRGGGTIDYVFLGTEQHIAVDQHFSVAMNSDHSAVVADLRLTGVPTSTTAPVPAPEPAPAPTPVPPASSGITFTPTRLVVKPSATPKERRQIRRLQLRAIRATEPGTAIHVATSQMQGRVLYRALVAAHGRGVDVTVLLGRKKLNAQDKALRSLLGTQVDQASWFRAAPRAWKRSSVAGAVVAPPQKPTTLLISRAGATPAFSLVSNAAMHNAPLRPNYRRRSTARVTVDHGTYDTLYRQYLAHVGRTY